MMVCPFGSVVIHDKKAQRCDQCPDQDTPACIKACSKRAISLVDTEKLKMEKQKQYLDKLSGVGKKKKQSQFVNILTTNTRAKKSLNKGD